MIQPATAPPQIPPAEIPPAEIPLAEIPLAEIPLAEIPLVDVITARLTRALAPSHLLVSNDSAQHAGHLGDDGTGESHFSVTIESPAFTGLSRVARQRLVNEALADLLSSRIHALAIRARGPGEG